MKKLLFPLFLLSFHSSLFGNIPAHCKLIRKQLEVHQQPIFSPKVFSKLTQGPNWATDPSESADQNTYQVGIALDLLQWINRSTEEAYASNECERITQQLEFEETLLHIPLVLEKEALLAQEAWLEKKRANFQVETTRFKEKWKAHVVSLQDLWQRKKWLVLIDLKQHEIRRNLKKFPETLRWMTASELGKLERNLTHRSVQTAMAQEKRQIPNPWNLSLQTGWTRRTLTTEGGHVEAPSQPRPYFASLELSYLFFAPTSSTSKMSDLEAAHREDLETGLHTPHTQLLALQENFHQERETKKGRLSILQTYLQDLDKTVTAMGSRTHNNDGLRVFAFQLQQEKFGYELEKIYLASQIEKTNLFLNEITKENSTPTAIPSIPSDAQIISTLGTLERTRSGAYTTSSNKLRTKLKDLPGTGLSVSFLYQGATEEKSKLSSGRIRTQLGFFLRALNQCNGLYMMLRIGEKTELVVQSKLNPGKSTHMECEANGYKTIAPQGGTPILQTSIQPGDRFILKAKVSRGQLQVFFNQALLWQGPIPENELANPGYAAIRSDNAKIEFEILKDEPINGT